MESNFSSSQQTTISYGVIDGASSGDNPDISLADTTENRTDFQHLLDDIIRVTSSADDSSSITVSTKLSISEAGMDIAKELTKKYPLITIDDEVLGEPRLAGTRFGISDVLSAFCIYDSIDEIIKEHGNRYSEKQLKDAVRFARDFLDSFFTSNV